MTSYWSASVEQNFALYCHPNRPNRNYLEDFSFERFKEMDRQSHNILDLPKLLQSSNIVRDYIDSNGLDSYHSKIEVIQREIVHTLGYNLEDMYFEQIDISICTHFFIEVSTKPCPVAE